jgi:subtilisin family serine protease
MKTKVILMFAILSLITSISIIANDNQEVIYRVPEYTVNNIQDIETLSETKPGFLRERGNYQRFKELSGNGKGIKVGIVDTGLDRIHSEANGELPLGSAVIEVKDFTSSRTRPLRGYKKPWEDRVGHGTHVAGHIGARANGKGIEGIASECDLYIAKGLGDNGAGSSLQIARAIDWLVAKDVDIINLSIGGSFSQDIENSVVAARKKGVLVFAAMGNEGTQGASHPGTSNSSFGVTAVDYDLKVANFSSRSRLAFFCGYGVNITSLTNGGRYATFSGTSMATPDQAGLAALVLGYARKNNIKVENMDDYSKFVGKSVLDLGETGRDREYGYGFIVLDMLFQDKTQEEIVEEELEEELPLIPIPEDGTPEEETPEEEPETPSSEQPPNPENPATPYQNTKIVAEIKMNNKKYILLEVLD